jgi:hypothetical protein
MIRVSRWPGLRIATPWSSKVSTRSRPLYDKADLWRIQWKLGGRNSSPGDSALRGVEYRLLPKDGVPIRRT